MRFNIQELQKLREITEADVSWLEKNPNEVDRLHAILGSREDTLQAISRCLDFVSLYKDLDTAGDWALVRQIVLNEMLTDRVHIQLHRVATDNPDEEPRNVDPKVIAELGKLLNNLQTKINSMVGTLGTARKDRRKDTREEQSIIIQGVKLQTLAERVSKGRRQMLDVGAKVIEDDGGPAEQ